ncbi:MAG: restriction endonuclease subunit S [Anaerococcus sp.]|nr:restriction endonuclease subunit S [Anaerococcus sp.]
MSWNKEKIINICTKVTSGGTPKSTNSEFYNPEEIPWLKTGEVNYCRIYDTETYISKEGLARSSAKLIPENSVIIAMYGQGDTAGRVAINKIPLSTNQACCNLIINHEIADYEYVYYTLSTLYNKLVSLKNGGAQPNLNAGIIKEIEIPFPNLVTQKKIASILSDYDYLIENNKKQIKLLEEAAQRIYKEWFVDLHFPGYEDVEIVDGLPEGWKNVSLRNMISFDIGGGWGEENIKEKSEKPAYVIRGTDLYGITHGDMSSIPFRYHTESNLSSRILQEGDIVFEVSGGSKTEGVARTLLITKEMLESYGSPVICASFCKLVRINELPYSQYMYDTFQFLRSSGKTTEFDKKSASSIVNYRWKDFLAQQNILVPPHSILDTYNCIAESLYHQIINHSKQIESLKNARDRLLPKLMSGEIEV